MRREAEESLSCQYREGVGEDVAQAWTNEMDGVKWTGVQGGLNMQCEEVLQDVRVWLWEFNCLWLQQRPRYEIEVGPAAGALRRLAGDLGVPLDDFGYDSGLDWDEAGPSRSGQFLDKDLTRWGHGRGSQRVVRKVDFSAASDLFVVSLTRVLGNGLGDVGAGGPVPAPGNGGVVQVVPALPQTPQRASSIGGEGALVWQWRMWTWVVRILWGSCLHLERKEADVGTTAKPY